MGGKRQQNCPGEQEYVELTELPPSDKHMSIEVVQIWSLTELQAGFSVHEAAGHCPVEVQGGGENICGSLIAKEVDEIFARILQ